MKIKDAIDILEREWSAQGACASCAWHSLMSEYDLEQITINEEKNRIELPCGSGAIGHRGVRVYYKTADA